MKACGNLLLLIALQQFVANYCLAQAPDGPAELTMTGLADAPRAYVDLRSSIKIEMDRHGKWLIAAGGSPADIKIWSLADGKLLHVVPGTEGIPYEIVGDNDLVPIENTGHAGYISDMALSLDGTRLFTAGSDDWMLKSWSIPSMDWERTLWIIDKDAPRTSVRQKGGRVAISGDGRRLLATDRYSFAANVWALPGGEALARIRVSYRRPKVALSHDGSVVATLEDNTGKGKKDTIELWSLPDGQLVRTLGPADHGAESIWHIAISPYQDWLIAVGTGPEDLAKRTSGRVFFPTVVAGWSVPSGEKIFEFQPPGRPGFIDVTADEVGNTLLAMANSTTATVMKLPEGRPLSVVKVEPKFTYAGGQPSVALSGDGQTIALGGHERLVVCRIPDRSCTYLSDPSVN